jgi:hypothetical protein
MPAGAGGSRVIRRPTAGCTRRRVECRRRRLALVAAWRQVNDIGNDVPPARPARQASGSTWDTWPCRRLSPFGQFDEREARGVPEVDRLSCCAFVFVDEPAEDVAAVELPRCG